MGVSFTVWAVTIGVLSAVILFDLFLAVRHQHEPSLREATIWVSIYVSLAIAFSFYISAAFPGNYGREFLAGWLTEYSLSVDNLFVFVIIMARLAVPAVKQQMVLLFGIILALVLRGIFIALGAAAIARFAGIFLLFGAFLLFTAWKLVDNDDEEEWKEGRLLRYLRGRGWGTVTLALVAVGTTDLLFALDSIPAIFGLTKEPYLVFTANVFALMGLRQLFFLLRGLMQRLIHLSNGLAIILAFIGIKLIFEGLHGINIDYIGPLYIPDISIEVSLGVIAAALGVTTLTSLRATRRIRLDAIEVPVEQDADG
jgi:tellurite resistance protein TerC